MPASQPADPRRDRLGVLLLHPARIRAARVPGWGRERAAALLLAAGAGAVGPAAAVDEPVPMSASATLGLGGALLLAYVVPLFYPPPSFPLGHVVPPDAWLLQRIFPSVP